MLTLRRFLRRTRRVPSPADPARYWESRARGLVDAYDHPKTWAARGWADDEIERRIVPRLLKDADVRSVLVVGCGSGRQYDLLSALGLEICGFDIAPTLVKVCRERYPEIQTDVDDVIGAGARRAPVDAVYSTHVLQHVNPSKVGDAVRSLKALARKIIVIREATALSAASDYQWAHDYDQLFVDCLPVQRVVTETSPRHQAELIAWRPRRG